MTYEYIFSSEHKHYHITFTFYSWVSMNEKRIDFAVSQLLQCTLQLAELLYSSLNEPTLYAIYRIFSGEYSYSEINNDHVKRLLEIIEEFCGVYTTAPIGLSLTKTIRCRIKFHTQHRAMGWISGRNIRIRCLLYWRHFLFVTCFLDCLPINYRIKIKIEDHFQESGIYFTK